jgi:hypothetical protein
VRACKRLRGRVRECTKEVSRAVAAAEKAVVVVVVAAVAVAAAAAPVLVEFLEGEEYSEAMDFKSCMVALLGSLGT